ncbi:MAG: hypothetical protein R3C19_07335 [Planctomycetaceae bacterium]
MQSAVVVFPNDVQAALIVNSNSIPAFSPTAALRNAYDNSFTKVAIAGTNGPDTFTVSVSGGTLILTIDEGNDGPATPDEVFIAPIAVLEQLTLVGLNGDDTFIINQLPADLELVIHAGRGSDTLNLTPGDSASGRNLDTISDRITFVGGPVNSAASDSDTVNIYDDNNPTADTYYVNSTWFDKTGFDRFNYTRIDELNLWTGSAGDVIRVNSLASDISLNVDSGAGNDRIYIGAANISGNIHGLIDVVTGPGDDDRLIFDDRNGSVADDFYVFQTDYFQSAVIPVIEWDSDSPPETITLWGSGEDSTTNIQGVLDGVLLRIEGRGGNDVINLHSVDAGGRTNLYGGDGNDTIALTPTGRNLDAIQGRVYANGGNGNFDRVELHDEDNTDSGRLYRFQSNWFDVVGSPFYRLYYTGSVETVELYAGNDDDTFDVRSTSTAAVVAAYGNGGSDTLNVAAGSRDLDSINGPLYFSGGTGDGIDAVVLNDQNDLGNDSYTLTTDPPSSVTKTGGFQFNHLGVEDLTLNANDANNTIVIGGAWALQATNYTIYSGDGADTVTVNASAPMHVTVNGDEGLIDRLHVRGTPLDDVVTISGNELQLGATTVVSGDGVERRTLDTGASLDLLSVQGQAGVDERFTVQASTTPGSGSIRAVTVPTWVFTNLEDVEVRGNAGDSDALDFRGTSLGDTFIVNPVAEGTATRPVVTLNQPGVGTLLNLRDFSDVGIPTIFGLAGADVFRVNVFPTQPEFEIRDIRLDGGDPQPVKPGEPPQPGDTLIVSFNENLFVQLPSTIGPHSGHIRLGHDDQVLDLLYLNFEEISGNLDLPF